MNELASRSPGYRALREIKQVTSLLDILPMGD